MSDENMDGVDLDLNVDPEDANALIYQVLSPQNNAVPLRSPGNYLDEDKSFDYDWILPDTSAESNRDDDIFQMIEDLNYPRIPMIAQTAESRLPGVDLQEYQASSAIESAYHCDPTWLNECHRMQLKAYYQNIFIAHDEKPVLIEQPEGAFVFYHNQNEVGVPPGIPSSVTPVGLPMFPPTYKDKKVAKFTAAVLGDMTRGLHLQYHNGFIYATRHCISRVFYWSPLMNTTQSVKLERQKPTPVFEFHAYFDRLQRLAKEGHDFRNEKRPVVVFTFGQQWNGSSSNLKDMFVRVEVTPVKAVEALHVCAGWDGMSTSTSIKEGDIERSEGGSCIMSIT